MKKTLALIVIFVLATALAAFALFTLNEWDSPLGWAKEMYPLGKEYVYIIEENPEMSVSDGKVLQGAYYFIALPEDTQSQHEASGRQIGKFDASLAQYVGKRVHVFGNFYKGYLYLRKPSNQPQNLRGDQNVLIHVNNVELAD